MQELEAKGKLKPGTVEKWEHDTAGRALPPRKGAKTPAIDPSKKSYRARFGLKEK